MARRGGREIVDESRAFHSIYFETLGEHGWVGLGIFLAIFAVFFFDMRRIRRRVRNRPDLGWLGDFARAFEPWRLIFMAGAAFIGVSYYPLQYYLFALAVSTSAALRRAGAAPAATSVELPLAPILSAGWRQRVTQVKVSR